MNKIDNYQSWIDPEQWIRDMKKKNPLFFNDQHHLLSRMANPTQGYIESVENGAMIDLEAAIQERISIMAEAGCSASVKQVGQNAYEIVFTDSLTKKQTGLAISETDNQGFMIRESMGQSNAGLVKRLQDGRIAIVASQTLAVLKGNEALKNVLKASYPTETIRKSKIFGASSMSNKLVAGRPTTNSYNAQNYTNAFVLDTKAGNKGNDFFAELLPAIAGQVGIANYFEEVIAANKNKLGKGLAPTEKQLQQLLQEIQFQAFQYESVDELEKYLKTANPWIHKNLWKRDLKNLFDWEYKAGLTSGSKKAGVPGIISLQGIDMPGMPAELLSSNKAAKNLRGRQSGRFANSNLARNGGLTYLDQTTNGENKKTRKNVAASLLTTKGQRDLYGKIDPNSLKKGDPKDALHFVGQIRNEDLTNAAYQLVYEEIFAQAKSKASRKNASEQNKAFFADLEQHNYTDIEEIKNFIKRQEGTEYSFRNIVNTLSEGKGKSVNGDRINIMDALKGVEQDASVYSDEIIDDFKETVETYGEIEKTKVSAQLRKLAKEELTKSGSDFTQRVKGWLEEENERLSREFVPKNEQGKQWRVTDAILDSKTTKQESNQTPGFNRDDPDFYLKVFNELTSERQDEIIQAYLDLDIQGLSPKEFKKSFENFLQEQLKKTDNELLELPDDGFKTGLKNLRDKLKEHNNSTGNKFKEDGENFYLNVFNSLKSKQKQALMQEYFDIYESVKNITSLEQQKLVEKAIYNTLNLNNKSSQERPEIIASSIQQSDDKFFFTKKTTYDNAMPKIVAGRTGDIRSATAPVNKHLLGKAFLNAGYRPEDVYVNGKDASDGLRMTIAREVQDFKDKTYRSNIMGMLNYIVSDAAIRNQNISEKPTEIRTSMLAEIKGALRKAGEDMGFTQQGIRLEELISDLSPEELAKVGDQTYFDFSNELLKKILESKIDNPVKLLQAIGLAGQYSGAYYSDKNNDYDINGRIKSNKRIIQTKVNDNGEETVSAIHNIIEAQEAVRASNSDWSGTQQDTQARMKYGRYELFSMQNSIKEAITEINNSNWSDEQKKQAIEQINEAYQDVQARYDQQQEEYQQYVRMEEKYIDQSFNKNLVGAQDRLAEQVKAGTAVEITKEEIESWNLDHEFDKSSGFGIIKANKNSGLLQIKQKQIAAYKKLIDEQKNNNKGISEEEARKLVAQKYNIKDASDIAAGINFGTEALVTKDGKHSGVVYLGKLSNFGGELTPEGELVLEKEDSGNPDSQEYMRLDESDMITNSILQSAKNRFAAKWTPSAEKDILKYSKEIEEKLNKLKNVYQQGSIFKKYEKVELENGGYLQAAAMNGDLLSEFGEKKENATRIMNRKDFSQILIDELKDAKQLEKFKEDYAALLKKTGKTDSEIEGELNKLTENEESIRDAVENYSSFYTLGNKNRQLNLGDALESYFYRSPTLKGKGDFETSRSLLLAEDNLVQRGRALLSPELFASIKADFDGDMLATAVSLLMGGQTSEFNAIINAISGRYALAQKATGDIGGIARLPSGKADDINNVGLTETQKKLKAAMDQAQKGAGIYGNQVYGDFLLAQQAGINIGHGREGGLAEIAAALVGTLYQEGINVKNLLNSGEDRLPVSSTLLALAGNKNTYDTKEGLISLLKNVEGLGGKGLPYKPNVIANIKGGINDKSKWEGYLDVANEAFRNAIGEEEKQAAQEELDAFQYVIDNFDHMQSSESEEFLAFISGKEVEVNGKKINLKNMFSSRFIAEAIAGKKGLNQWLSDNGRNVTLGGSQSQLYNYATDYALPQYSRSKKIRSTGTAVDSLGNQIIKDNLAIDMATKKLVEGTVAELESEKALNEYIQSDYEKAKEIFEKYSEREKERRDTGDSSIYLYETRPTIEKMAALPPEYYGMQTSLFKAQLEESSEEEWKDSLSQLNSLSGPEFKKAQLALEQTLEGSFVHLVSELFGNALDAAEFDDGASTKAIMNLVESSPEYQRAYNRMLSFYQSSGVGSAEELERLKKQKIELENSGASAKEIEKVEQSIIANLAAKARQELRLANLTSLGNNQGFFTTQAAFEEGDIPGEYKLLSKDIRKAAGFKRLSEARLIGAQNGNAIVPGTTDAIVQYIDETGKILTHFADFKTRRSGTLHAEDVAQIESYLRDFGIIQKALQDLTNQGKGGLSGREYLLQAFNDPTYNEIFAGYAAQREKDLQEKIAHTISVEKRKAESEGREYTSEQEQKDTERIKKGEMKLYTGESYLNEEESWNSNFDKLVDMARQASEEDSKTVASINVGDPDNGIIREFTIDPSAIQFQNLLKRRFGIETAEGRPVTVQDLVNQGFSEYDAKKIYLQAAKLTNMTFTSKEAKENYVKNYFSHSAGRKIEKYHRAKQELEDLKEEREYLKSIGAPEEEVSKINDKIEKLEKRFSGTKWDANKQNADGTFGGYVGGLEDQYQDLIHGQEAANSDGAMADMEEQIKKDLSEKNASKRVSLAQKYGTKKRETEAQIAQIESVLKLNEQSSFLTPEEKEKLQSQVSYLKNSVLEAIQLFLAKTGVALEKSLEESALEDTEKEELKKKFEEAVEGNSIEQATAGVQRQQAELAALRQKKQKEQAVGGAIGKIYSLEKRDKDLQKMLDSTSDSLSKEIIQQQIQDNKELLEDARKEGQVYGYNGVDDQGKIITSENGMYSNNPDILQRQYNKIKLQDDLQRRAQQKSSSTSGMLADKAFSVMKYLTSASSLVRGFNKLVQGMQKAAQQAANLNKQITNLQIVTGKSEISARTLVSSYSSLAQSLGATTAEVTQSAQEWMRQGYELSEVTDLVTASTYLSKLGMMDAASATSSLTSSLKGFKMQASEAMDVVDKLTAIDMEAATSAGEIANALAQFANLGSLSGVSIDQAAAYAATIADVSQRSGASTGQALKTIISRYGNVKAGAYNKLTMNSDEVDGDNAVNDVERVLSKLGISIRDSVSSFKDFDVILEEIAERWSTLDNVSKKAIATAFAGTRQQEAFVTLLENWDKYESLLSTSQNSSGTAEKKYDAYKESLEAERNKLTAKIEGVLNSAEFDNFLTELIKFAQVFVDTVPQILKYLPRLIRSMEYFKSLGGNSFTQQFLGKIKAGFDARKNQNGKDNLGILGTLSYDFSSSVQAIKNYKSPKARRAIASIIGNNKQVTELQGKIDQKAEQIKQNQAKIDGLSIGRGNEAKKQALTDENVKLQEESSKLGESIKNLNKETEDLTNKYNIQKATIDKATQSENKNTREKDENTQASKENTDAVDNNTDANNNNSGSEGGAGASGGSKWQAIANGVTVALGQIMAGVSAYMTSGTSHKNSRGEIVADSSIASKRAKTIDIIASQIPILGTAISNWVTPLVEQATDRVRDEIQIVSSDANEMLSKLNSIDQNVSSLTKGSLLDADASVLERKELVDALKKELFASDNADVREALNRALSNNGIESTVTKLLDKYENGSKEERIEAAQQIQLAQLQVEGQQQAAARASEYYDYAEKLNEATTAYNKLSSVDLAGVAVNSNGITDKDQSLAVGHAAGTGLVGGAVSGAAAAGMTIGTSALTAAGTGAAAGAAGGTTINPGVGTLIGVIVGVIAGAAVGIIQYQQKVEEFQRKQSANWSSKSLEEQYEIAEQVRLQKQAALDYYDSQESLSEDEKDRMEEIQESLDALEEYQEANLAYQEYLIQAAKEDNEQKISEAILQTKVGDDYLTNMSKDQLLLLKNSGIYEALAEQLESDGTMLNGVAIRYNDGRITEQFQKLAYSLLAEDEEIAAALSGSKSTLQDTYDTYWNDYKDGTATEKYFAEQILQNYATALNVPVDELENLLNTAGMLSLEELMKSTSDLISETEGYNSLLSSVTDATQDESKWMSEIVENYPDLITYMSDTPALMDKIIEKTQQLSRQVLNAQAAEYFESDSFFTDLFKEAKNTMSKESYESMEALRAQNNIADIEGLRTWINQNPNSTDEGAEELRNLLTNSDLFNSITVKSSELESLYTQLSETMQKHYQDEIEILEQQKTALEQQSTQREYETKLLEARLELENAQKEKSRVYRDGVGWVYEADQEKIAQAQKNLEELKIEKSVSAIEKQITLLTEKSSNLQKIYDVLKEESSTKQAEIFMEKLGINGESYSTIAGYIENGISNGAQSTLSKIYESVRDTDEKKKEEEEEELIEATQAYLNLPDNATEEEKNATKERYSNAFSNYSGGSAEAQKIVNAQLRDKGYMTSTGDATDAGKEFFSREDVSTIVDGKKSAALKKVKGTGAANDTVSALYKRISAVDKNKQFKTATQRVTEFVEKMGLTLEDFGWQNKSNEEMKGIQDMLLNSSSRIESFLDANNIKDTTVTTSVLGNPFSWLQEDAATRSLSKYTIAVEDPTAKDWLYIAKVDTGSTLPQSSDAAIALQDAIKTNDGNVYVYDLEKPSNSGTANTENQHKAAKNTEKEDFTTIQKYASYAGINNAVVVLKDKNTNTLQHLYYLSGSNLMLANGSHESGLFEDYLEKDELYDKHGGIGTELNKNNKKVAQIAGYALGSLNTSSALSWVNELGTEAIITPQGTLTTLPSHSGIVPADVTKNLWELGELAPSLMKGLELILKPDTIGQSMISSSSTDESFNVSNLTMNVQASDGFNADAFVESIKQRVALTRNLRR